MKFDKKVIDSHYHIYNWFDKNGKTFWETTGAYRDGRGFRNVNINTLPSVKRDVSNNIMVALYKLYHPDFYAHGGLIYDTYPVPAVMTEGMDPLTQYKELMEIGFDGIKMLETKPTEIKAIGRTVDDPLYADFFAAVEQDGTHMVWHVNDPDIFWDINKIPADCLEAGWYYGDGTYPAYETIYKQALAVLERHPSLKVSFAHFFFLSEDPERLEEIFAKYPGVSVDLTPGVEMYGGFGKRCQYYYDFFNRYADRIEYGTDAHDGGEGYNWVIADTVYRFLTTDDDFDIWDYQFKGLKLPEETTEKILWKNFAGRVGETPKPINVAALKAYVEKYKHLIQDEKVRELILDAISKVE